MVGTSYALGNFKAVGLLLESASGGAISFALGVGLLAVIMAIYESVGGGGGMRAVVWTDVLQGVILMLGCLLIFFAVYTISDQSSVTHAPQLMVSLRDYFVEQWHVVNFASLVFLIAVGAAVYPQAIQRIYAARSDTTLVRSYRLMFFMPLLTSFPMILVGMSVAEWLPSLPVEASEQVIILAINRVVEVHPMMTWLLILCLGAALAAIMSTIDSALLSLGSLITSDVLGPRLVGRDAKALHRFSRVISWVLMVVVALMAVVLPQTIWALMVLKFELLIQVAPAIILGVHSSHVDARAVLGGLVMGCVVTIGLKLSRYLVFWGLADWSQVGGIHSGVWGLLANVLTVLLMPRQRVAAAAQKDTNHDSIL